MTLSELNALGSEQFAKALGWVFEESPWVAERAYAHAPFSSIDSLHAAMVAEVVRATVADRLALLRAHPDLGTRAKISDASETEQSGAGLDQLTPEEFERITHLNATYRQRFGFPFLYAVRGSTKHDILGAMEQRLKTSYETEFEEALRQVYRIARFRLENTIS